jgi:hypothetical protein
VASANQAVVNEVDRPGLIRRHWSLACHAQMAQPLAPAPSAQGRQALRQSTQVLALLLEPVRPG